MTNMPGEDQTEMESAMPSADQFECIDPELGELLAAYVEGLLAGYDRQLFAAHLHACVRCAEEERLMREVARGIASLRSRPDPAAALPPGAVARSRMRPTHVLASAGVAAVLVALLAWWPRATGHDPTDTRALEARIEHLESQNAVLARTVAMERARWEASPLAGIPIAAPPNF
jgi:hypothetical protein